jgi:hypothetical protein
MDISSFVKILYPIALWTLVLSSTSLIILTSVYLIRKTIMKRKKIIRPIRPAFPIPILTITGNDDADITQYKTTRDIVRSRNFSAGERQKEYRRRGKSPSGVIDGVYNDAYLENGASYNDMDRDWDADA